MGDYKKHQKRITVTYVVLFNIFRFLLILRTRQKEIYFYINKSVKLTMMK